MRFRALVALLVAISLAGCSDQQSQSETGYSEYDHPESFESQITAAIEQATISGANSRQIDLLEAAQENGGVSLQIAQEANRNYADCAQAAGLAVTIREDSTGVGWVDIGTVTTRPEDMSDEAAESAIVGCENSENHWVNYVYQTQPMALEATLRYLEQQAPVLFACLEDAGFNPSTDASPLDLAKLAIGDEARAAAGVACLQEADIDRF